MRLLNFAIIKLTVCLILGIVLGYYLNVPLSISLLFSGLLLVILLLLYAIARKQFTKTIWFGIVAFLTMISIGILTTNLHNQKNFSNHYTNHISEVKDDSEAITFRIREILKPSNYYEKYVVDVLDVDGAKSSGKSLLNIEKDSLNQPLKIDAVFVCKTNFQEMHPPLNPHQFNYKNYLEKKYIYHQLFTKRASLLEGQSNTITLLGMADAVRTHINKKMKPYHFKTDELAIINALLLGQRQDITEEVYTSYADAGVIHILAVSGLHVGIILLILSFLLKPIERYKYGKLFKTILLVLLLWSFAIVAGLSASVTRAVTMFSIVAIAWNLKRPTNIYNTLAISMFIILLFKPLFIFDVGFQLSYLAVFAIVSIDPLLYKLWKPKYWVTDKLWHIFTVTVSAQFGVLPLSLFYFHQFPGLFFISNLIIIPFIGIILSMGILLILLAVLKILPQFYADFFGRIIDLMNAFVGWVAKQESFLFKDIPFSLLYVLVFYMMFIMLFRLIFKRNYSNLKFFLISILLVQGAFIYTSYAKPSKEFIVFHKSRFSLLGNTTNNKVLIASDLDSISKLKNNTVKDYTVGSHIMTIEEDSIQPFYKLNDKTFLIVDSLGVYNVNSFQHDYVLLRQSPKVNLNRLIDSISPKQIIADGSNYTSYVEQWERICQKRKIPFHQTGKKGAFIVSY
ncbi:ComEC/Rec2 family competence protein [Tamlana flava]|uniref:ComEC/Rec2 family competence protein n=1 Tax=Tamlana flava TaxID=3158572 RepID=UPI00351BE981